MATKYIPVWLDHYTQMPSATQDYIVQLDGNTIYAGRAWNRPCETYPQVRINDIAAAYLSQNFPLAADYLLHPAEYVAADLLKTFKVYDDDGLTQIDDDLVFALDWSGQGEEDDVIGMQSGTGHRHIVQKVVDGMPIILTLFNDTPIPAEEAGWIYVETESHGDYDIVEYSGPGNYVLPDWTVYGDVLTDTWVRWGPLTFDVIPACKVRFVLYYVNAHGCWDSLPLEGACRLTYDYDRKNLERVYNNDPALLGRGTVNYRNDVRRSWQLHTGWVDELGASRMHHLIGSTLVYLLDLQEREIHPVTITDTQVSERKFTDEVAPVVYQINVTEAREGVRR